MTEVNQNNDPLTQSLEQYGKIWAESLEQFQKVMQVGQPYLKPWTESLDLFQKTITAGASYMKTWAEALEQYQKMTESFFRPTSARSPNE